MKKLKNESGSALILALFVMILVSIIIVSFSNQVVNQMKSTINLYKDMQEMYEAESDIEELIADFIKNIDVKSEYLNYRPYIDFGNYKLYYNNYNEDPNVDVEPQKEGNNSVNFIITIKVKSKENKVIEESKIKVRVSNISNENEYSIDYAVESWRERNTGVDSLND
ncbi:pilus assembly PilX N-terminal domain-containing protein [Romboutsia ilealis]|uniref:pilus assembly PilX N-terminal domain-containing protein n=1 Tax=Romboutsia ilealis TaxID=1115758 RepID=UPI0025747877|nr:pilus assembly PilX N-terminal domain-containing protein [Romboutsia ilealis]